MHRGMDVYTYLLMAIRDHQKPDHTCGIQGRKALTWATAGVAGANQKRGYRRCMLLMSSAVASTSEDESRTTER